MREPHKFVPVGLHPNSCTKCGMPKSHVLHVTKGYRRPRIRWDRIFHAKRAQWKVYSNV